MVFGSSVGSVITNKLSVGTMPVKAACDPQSPASGRTTLEIYNTDAANAVYLGDKNVSASTGLPIPAKTGKIIPVNRFSGDSLYLVAEAAVDVIIAEYMP